MMYADDETIEHEQRFTLFVARSQSVLTLYEKIRDIRAELNNQLTEAVDEHRDKCNLLKNRALHRVLDEINSTESQVQSLYPSAVNESDGKGDYNTQDD